MTGFALRFSGNPASMPFPGAEAALFSLPLSLETLLFSLPSVNPRIINLICQKERSMKRLALVLAVMFSVSLARADKIWLSDGSVLVGQVQQVFKGKATIKTDFAGVITIDQAKIVNIETAQPLHGVLNNNERLSGKVTPGEAGQVKVEGVAAPVALNNVKALWMFGASDPTIPAPPAGRKWSGEASVDVSGKTGNTEKFTGGAGLKGIMEGPQDRLMLYVNGTYARENSVTNEKEYRFGADYERMIANTHNSWFAKIEFEKDDFGGYKLRTHAVAGYGYFFFKEPDHQLRFRIGGSYMRKEYYDGEKDNVYGLDLNLHYERLIDEWGKLVSDVTYTPALDDVDDYRIYHESALDIPLLMKKPLSLRLGISNEYNNLVAEGAERLDTTYFAKLVYKWK